ncbi:MAG: cupin-like domain-containing protein [Caulobacterales bacterium]
MIKPGLPARAFDKAAFGIEHQLAKLDLFSDDYITRLADLYTAEGRDYFVSTPAPSASTSFFDVAHGMCTPKEALVRLPKQPVRILLKLLENHDEGFRALRDSLLEEIRTMCGIEGPVFRARAALFISSARAITPVHFDPEVNFFLQVEGEKQFHTYSPSVVPAPELERFYARGEVSVCNVDLERLPDSARETFKLSPGLGLHQPQNSPHWVETGPGRSVSYSLVFETPRGRQHARVNAFNSYLRSAGLKPPQPGSQPLRDALKGATMRVATPIRRKAVHLHKRFVQGA